MKNLLLISAIILSVGAISMTAHATEETNKEKAMELRKYDKAKAFDGPADYFTGDVVWFPAHEKHWHGAAPDSPMSHLAIQSPDENGEVVTWMEKVSVEDYLAEE